MKATISIIAGIYWIFFFIHPEGMYPMHLFELFIALGLTIFVGIIEYKEIPPNSSSDKSESFNKGYEVNQK